MDDVGLVVRGSGDGGVCLSRTGWVRNEHHEARTICCINIDIPFGVARCGYDSGGQGGCQVGMVQASGPVVWDRREFVGVVVIVVVLDFNI